MYGAYQWGRATAQQTLGLTPERTKEAGFWDKFLRRIARGKGLARPASSAAEAAKAVRPSLREFLIGNPEHLITQPGQLLRTALSLQPAREALTAIRGQGPGGAGLWARTKGVGRLGLETLNKAFILGLPAYGVHQALTTPRAPGETTGERIGKAVGEGLGWLPPMGALGTIATLFTPEYSMPGLTGQVGGTIGHGISNLLGEKPAPMYPLNYMTGLSPDTYTETPTESTAYAETRSR